jgi:hypothetical protein
MKTKAFQFIAEIDKEFTLPKISINISWMLKLGLNGPSVCCRASRATRKTLLVISPERMENKIHLIAELKSTKTFGNVILRAANFMKNLKEN